MYCEVQWTVRNAIWIPFMMAQLWRCFCHGSTPLVDLGLLISRFRDHTPNTLSTLGRTPLNERSARRRDLHLLEHNTHRRQTSMPSAGFDPTNSSKREAAYPRLIPRDTGIDTKMYTKYNTIAGVSRSNCTQVVCCNDIKHALHKHDTLYDRGIP